MVEYALLLTVIAVICISSVTVLSGESEEPLSQAAEAIDSTSGVSDVCILWAPIDGGAGISHRMQAHDSTLGPIVPGPCP